MNGMKEFYNEVTSLGGIWDSNDVYFSQQRDQYTAEYKPKYPQGTPDDQMIIRHLDHTELAQKRGRYEFIRFYPDCQKCLSYYARTLDELATIAKEA